MQILPINDGVDHINIYTKGATWVGRALTNLYPCTFTVPGYGAFNSLEGFWYYYLTGCQFQEFFGYDGFAAKKAGKKLTAQRIDNPEEMEDHHKQVILEAIRCKLRQNRDILEALWKSDLPFAHYYYYGDRDNAKVILLPKYDWMVDEFTRLRKLLKEEWRNEKS